VTSLDYIVNEKNEKVVFTNSVENQIHQVVIKPTKSDQREKDLNQEAKKYQMEVTNLPTGAQIAYLCLSKSTNYMFMGTTGAKNPGMIRCYKYPFQKDGVCQIQTHSLGVSKLMVTHDDSHLFSIGEDCNLIVYEMKDRDSKVKRDKESFGMQPSEEFLYDRQKYQKKVNKIEELQAAVNELEAKQAYENRTKEQEKKDKKNALESKKDQQTAKNAQ